MWIQTPVPLAYRQTQVLESQVGRRNLEETASRLCLLRGRGRVDVDLETHVGRQVRYINQRAELKFADDQAGRRVGFSWNVEGASKI